MFCFFHVSGWKITYLSFEEDPEPFGRVRDENIKAMCKEMGVKTVTEKSHTLYDLDRFVFQIYSSVVKKVRILIMIELSQKHR